MGGGKKLRRDELKFPRVPMSTRLINFMPVRAGAATNRFFRKSSTHIFRGQGVSPSTVPGSNSQCRLRHWVKASPSTICSTKMEGRYQTWLRKWAYDQSWPRGIILFQVLIGNAFQDTDSKQYNSLFHQKGSEAPNLPAKMCSWSMTTPKASHCCT